MAKTEIIVDGEIITRDQDTRFYWRVALGTWHPLGEYSRNSAYDVVVNAQGGKCTSCGMGLSGLVQMTTKHREFNICQPCAKQQYGLEIAPFCNYLDHGTIIPQSDIRFAKCANCGMIVENRDYARMIREQEQKSRAAFEIEWAYAVYAE